MVLFVQLKWNRKFESTDRSIYVEELFQLKVHIVSLPTPDIDGYELINLEAQIERYVLWKSQVLDLILLLQCLYEFLVALNVVIKSKLEFLDEL